MKTKILSPNRRLSAPVPNCPQSTMPRWERIGRIHDLLEQGAYPNATTLARDLRVTIKTIHRDVAYMREHLGLPVAFDLLRLGYYYDQATRCRPTQPMSDAELFGLLIAHRVVAQYTGTGMEASLRATMQKFMPQLGTYDYIVLDDMREAMSHLPRTPEPDSAALRSSRFARRSPRFAPTPNTLAA